MPSPVKVNACQQSKLYYEDMFGDVEEPKDIHGLACSFLRHID
jgi:hypothetical protein